MTNRLSSGAARAWVTAPALWIAAFWIAGLGAAVPATCDGTTEGELQGRPAPVFRRVCVGGPNAGALCNADADCAPSTCADRNVFNISVAVLFHADAAELNAVRDLVSAGSAMLFDVTDGQAEIGEAFIHNNAYSTSPADLRIYDATCSSGTNVGAACSTHADCPPNPPAPHPGSCGVWWQAWAGGWHIGGSIYVSIDTVLAELAPGESFAHEFAHLVFDTKDEYETANATCDANPASSDCPDPVTISAGEASCLMDGGGIGVDGQHSEFCWGHGDPTDLTDLSGGNHDADNETEQSVCRSGRSCWEQVVWSWPDVFAMPAGAPDPNAGGATVSPTHFVVTDDAVRVVLVLDESGSMGLESPSRMERLKVAAKDFVALAENGTEIGIVSYSDDAEVASDRVNLAIAALVADRSPWNDAIEDLSPDAYTNISAGLDKAEAMITAAGGVTANTFIVLMTDGLNNRPAPQATADAELTAKISHLNDVNIPVYVTCTGGDLGLDSQCSEIATGTGGFYVDSADAAQLPAAFVDFHERITGRETLGSTRSVLTKGGSSTFWVEEGSESVTFTLVWENPAASAAMSIVDPDGNQYRGLPMPQGRWARVEHPVPGDWRVLVDGAGSADESTATVEDSPYTVSAYTRNRVQSVIAMTRYPSVLPGERIWLYAHPRSLGGAISSDSETLKVQVTLPDGSMDTLELSDLGRGATDGVDDIGDDAIFTGVYGNTSQKGAYTFLLDADIQGWHSSGDHRDIDPNVESPRFRRQVRWSVAVSDPDDVEEETEDDVAQREKDRFGHWRLLLLLLLLLVVIVVYLLRRHRSKKVIAAG